MILKSVRKCVTRLEGKNVVLPSISVKLTSFTRQKTQKPFLYFSKVGFFREIKEQQKYIQGFANDYFAFEASKKLSTKLKDTN